MQGKPLTLLSISFEDIKVTFRRSYTKKISYEDDFHLPESGSLVQAIPVDPHSAVFGKHGQRLDDKSVVVAVTSGSTNNEHNGLPDVTSVSAAAVGAAVPAGIGYYHKNTFLSSFQPAGTTLLPPAAASAASPTTPEKGKETHTTSLWQSSSSSGEFDIDLYCLVIGNVCTHVSYSSSSPSASATARHT